jgi:hypothetical protein
VTGRDSSVSLSAADRATGAAFGVTDANALAMLRPLLVIIEGAP